MKKILTYCLLFFPILLISQTPEDCDKIIKLSITARQNREFTKSLELLTEAQKMAVENNWKLQEFLAKNNTGALYYEMSDAGQALKNYLEAYNIAIEFLDVQQEFTALNNIAIFYFDDKNYSKAEEYFQKAYDLAKKDSNSRKVALYGVNIGLAQNKQGKFNQALTHFDEAIPLIKNEDGYLLYAKYGKADNLFLQKKTNESLELLDQIINAPQGEKEKNSQINALLLKSKILKERKEISQALFLAKKAQQNSLSLEQKRDVYNHLFEIYHAQKNLNLSILYKDSIIWANDSLNIIRNSIVYENNKVKFEIINYKKELEESKERLQYERNLFYTIIFFITILLALLVWALRNNTIKYKQKKIIADRNQKIIALEYEKELELRNRKLTTKAIHLSYKNELIQSIIETFSNEPEIMQSRNLRKHVLQLQNHLKKDNELNDFFTHFEEANHGFISSIKSKHPELNSNDLRFIAYVYMDLSIKEISSLLNITTDACRKRKERISRKIHIEDTTLLYNYLHSFS